MSEGRVDVDRRRRPPSRRHRKRDRESRRWQRNGEGGTEVVDSQSDTEQVRNLARVSRHLSRRNYLVTIKFRRLTWENEGWSGN